MGRFVVRVCLFGLLVVVTIGGLCAVELLYEVRQYLRHEVVAPPEARIFIGNDSQTADAVDSRTYPQVFNFSSPARRMDQTHLALKDVLTANPGKFKVVLIDMSPIAAVEKFDQPISELGYAAQYYLLHWLHWKENTRDMSGQLKVCRDNMVGRRLRHFLRAARGKKKFVSSIGGEFQPRDESMGLLDPGYFKSQCEGRALYFNASPPVSESSDIFKYVDAILAEADKYGAEAVLMTTPLERSLRNALEEDRVKAFSKTVRDYAARNGCRYLDFMEEDFPADHWFDAQHLNVRGAKAFTGKLIKALEK